jgi:hypothetical protein
MGDPESNLQAVWFDIAEGITTAEVRFKKSYARAWFSLVWRAVMAIIGSLTA